MPAWKRAILSKQRERSRSQLQRKATHYYDRDGRKVALPAQNDDDDDDDDDDRRRGGKKGRKHKSEKDKRKGKGSKDSSDQRKGRDVQKGRKKSTADKKKKGPTNVDDFDEDDSSSSETSSSDSSSDSEESGQKNLTSEEAMKMLGTKWALGGEDDIEDLDERIKTQQLEIQRELSNLTQLQRSSGMKALPSLQQKVLQSDLQKLQAIQGKLKENPGVRELQMLLVGHQMLLCEHVKEIQESLTQFQQPPANDNGLHIPDELKPRMSPATSASHLPLPTNAPPPAPAPAPPPSAPAPAPAPTQVNVPPPYNNPMLAMAEQSQVNQMLQTELLMAAEQARRQQLTQQLLAQRRQQQLMAAAQLSSAGFGGMGMSAFSPLTPSFPLL